MSVQIVECPRDAMQGFQHPIATETKINYLNALLEVGFNTIDCGSFVSAKAVPQLADTAKVLKAIHPVPSQTRLLTIIANARGANRAAEFDNVSILGFPFSISETFQLRNTNQTIQQALAELQKIQRIGEDSKQEVLVYLSMGFGNPYGDSWSVDLAVEWCRRLADTGVRMINLSDTTGQANPAAITEMFEKCLHLLPELEFGAHFHTRPDNYFDHIDAAYQAGCRKFDAAIKGFGGCPFASDKLTGNLPTEHLIEYLKSQEEALSLNSQAFQNALQVAATVFV